MKSYILKRLKLVS